MSNGLNDELRNLKDEVYAGFETGNIEHSRSAMVLIRDKYPEQYLDLRNELVREYGISL